MKQFWSHVLCYFGCIFGLFVWETPGYAQGNDRFSWALHRQPNPDIEIDDGVCDDLLVSTSHSPSFLVGITCTTTSWPGGAGILVDSLDVTLLSGFPDLLHVTWTDIGAGASGSYGGGFFVCQADMPENILLEGSISFYVARGGGDFAENTYTITYEGGQLVYQQNMVKQSRRDHPTPLHHTIERDSSGVSRYLATIHTRLKKVYYIADSGVSISSGKTTLEYRVQSGDALEEICQAFRLQQAWIQYPPEEPPKAGTWLSITPPNTAIPASPREWYQPDWSGGIRVRAQE